MLAVSRHFKHVLNNNNNNNNNNRQHAHARPCLIFLMFDLLQNFITVFARVVSFARIGYYRPLWSVSIKISDNGKHWSTECSLVKFWPKLLHFNRFFIKKHFVHLWYLFLHCSVHFNYNFLLLPLSVIKMDLLINNKWLILIYLFYTFILFIALPLEIRRV